MRMSALPTQPPHLERHQLGPKASVALAQRNLVLVSLGEDGFSEVGGDGEESRVVRDLLVASQLLKGRTGEEKTHGDQ